MEGAEAEPEEQPELTPGQEGVAEAPAAGLVEVEAVPCEPLEQPRRQTQRFVRAGLDPFPGLQVGEHEGALAPHPALAQWISRVASAVKW